ncbi:TPA: lytic transglycosylase domain-containing protein [Klebsiella pneumoniae subsp. pneumoniae]|uniref:lytic transglycosylase domain-containing protein n=1 Tax=Klebsiella pneumoniae TaxID=573 RepID=UPI001034D888|nr:lytic transglycosylase domain-containing protein [Klebsiella pneumoniae]EAW8461791.1 lytic transglycosylase domain-containing protein [Salmonella enterica]EHX0164606.1 lytic transglycosylase domain-containing protein [Salmonella enterica]EJT4720267.1 lytic transglycosylase domain-containing protein [Salmonella enterica]MCJ6790469.1 lytic transglycosylase domain-containing protein [Klebsiella pneumoniae]UPF69806.1 lytic transglycosylase domain-containing protein [Klebsiella pneumoniae subsp.
MIKAGLLSLALQCSPQVHPDTVFDVAKTESGYNPYAIAEIIPKAERQVQGKSVITHMPASKEEALKIVKAIERKGRRYSVGLMQITSTNFDKFQTTAEKLFSPCHNLKISQQILVDCYQRGKTLKNALSCYYSGNFSTGKVKESEFANTSYVERIGFRTASQETPVIVPSTKEAIKNQEVKKNKTTKMLTIYPPYVIRGMSDTEDDPVQDNGENPS